MARLRSNGWKYNKWMMLSIALFMIAIIFGQSIHFQFNPHHYMIIHTFLEFTAIAVSFSIALQGWMVFPFNLSRHRLYISALFVLIGWLSLGHVFAYEGMTAWSSASLSSWFWIAAGLSESVGLIWILLSKERNTAKGERELVFSGAFVLCAVIFLLLLLNRDNLLPLVEVSAGTTELMNAFEFVIITFRMIVLALVLFRGKWLGKHTKSVRTIVHALTLLIMSEMLFTTYLSVYDGLNLLGHLFKIGGYYFIMQAVYLSYLEEPYLKQKKTEAELKRNRTQLQVITDTMGEGMLVMDNTGKLIYMNAEAERLLGWTFAEMHGKSVHETIHYMKEDGSPHPWEECKMRLNLFVKRVDNSRETDVFIRKDGTMFHMEYTSTPLHHEGEFTQAVVVFRDITDQKKKQERIRFLALYDELTGLPNRYYFRQMLTDAIALAESGSQKVGVLLLDIDRFKFVNDSLGHDAGDCLLKELAMRLRDPCRDMGAVVARMGGDEFLIMVPNVYGREELKRFSAHILRQFEAPFQLGGMDFYITPSIGISSYPDNGKDAETLIKYADVAMYDAKTQRNHYQFYSSEMDTRSIDLLHLENDLRGALERGELTLHYQPQIQAHSGECVGVEALLRWHHPSRGWVPPTDFIPLAEETGLIIAIEQWVLRESCMQMKSWLDAGTDFKRISVNVSNKRFHSASFYESVCSTLHETGLDPRYLDLEITENVTMFERATAAVMHRLKKLGVQISIDDFGTGYSSLGRLRELPIDRLKIDRSFIQGITASEEEAAIVTTIIAMARHLGLAVIAEGVEKQAEANFLKQQMCDEMQGFYFSKPLATQDLERFCVKN